MALDKVVDSAVLDAGMVIVADAIRAKAGITNQLVWPEGFKTAVDGIQTGGGSGGGQAFQCGSVVSSDGTNIVVPCTLDNILIVRKFPPRSKYTIYLLNATLILAQGVKFQIASTTSGLLSNQGTGKFSIAKENGQTTFTEKDSSFKFSDEYCYIAWDNAE